MSPYIRTVKTVSGATAVQVVHSETRGSKKLTHIGSAHTPQDLALLQVQAQRLVDGDQMSLDLGVDTTPAGTGTQQSPVPVTSEKAGHFIAAITTAYQQLGFDEVTDHDSVFADLVAAHIVQPGSTLDSVETLAEIGIASASYATIKRRLPGYATTQFRDQLTQACANHAGIGPGVLVLYDVTTLYFEADEGDEFRKYGFSKERRLEPQITVGLLTDIHGFPLSVGAFEGNVAETHTMLPMLNRFLDAFDIDEDNLTVVADAGMFSAANKQDIINAGMHYILGARFKDVPQVIAQWAGGASGPGLRGRSDLGGGRSPGLRTWWEHPSGDLLPVFVGPGTAHAQGH